jgi:hypothetical protein
MRLVVIGSGAIGLSVQKLESQTGSLHRDAAPASEGSIAIQTRSSSLRTNPSQGMSEDLKRREFAAMPFFKLEG